ncbi:hypothetical protein CWI36_0047p0010 [Hamiltosporidium magnivora]|uniref:Uncharacterized protein n=1 Tax=Hamiltosporidium magnivora TaxID=148818 RepID=A0A4Q9LLP0_9MICR|nr:hypothetical protein CWI36_0047p0010 [Hamiltosporidium magnivora]
MNDRRTYKNKKFEQNERMLDEDNIYLNEAMLKKTNIFLFSTLNEIIPVFLKIVRDTIIFERKAIKLGNITYQKIFPLLKEAKEILYNFYTKFLYFQIDLDSNYYLKALVSYFE